MEVQVSKSLTEEGHSHIIELDPVSDVVSIITFRDTVDGLSKLNDVTREFTWSKDNEEWSTWRTLSTTNLNSYIDFEAEKIWIKVKYIVTEKMDDCPIVIKRLELVLEQEETDPEEEKKQKFTPRNALEIVDEAEFNPYEVGESYKDFQHDMNRYINSTFGYEVKYFRKEPDEEATDVFLGEHTIRNVVESKCIEVVVPNNEIPEPKHEYDEWGINFDSFEIHISVDYWKKKFGKNTYPRNEDFIFFPQVNRLYYVSSNYEQRGIQEEPIYYVLYLQKYDEDTSTIKDKETEDFLEEKTRNREDVFGEQMQEEREDTTNNQQNQMKTITEDIVREVVHSDMEIVDEPLHNNGTLLLSSYYNMTDIPSKEVAVQYRQPHSLDEGDSWSYSSWFNIQKLAGPATEDLVLNIVDVERKDFSHVQIKFDKKISILNLSKNDAVRRIGSSEVLDIEEVVDEKTIITSSRSEIENLDNYIKANKINLLRTINEAADFVINLYDGNKLRVKYGNRICDFNDIGLEEEKWYGSVVNISNAHDFIGAYFWQIIDRKAEADDSFSTRLKNVYKNETAKDKPIVIEEANPFITGGNAYMSNIRVYKKAIRTDLQSLAISTQNVKKPSLAFLIDDADTIFNLGTLGRGHTYIQEKEAENRRGEGE